MRARLRLHAKRRVQDRYIVEVSIFEVERTVGYPEAIKYGLICKDLNSGQYVLLDNHHPKGHHLHLNEEESAYEYVSDEKLIEDFKELVLKHMGVKL